MMAARKPAPRLIERLPPVRGRMTEDAPLSRVTWFRVGGPAEVMFRPADADDLAAFLQQKPDDVPVTVIGVGSNLLVRDGGISGVVIRLGRGFNDIRVDGTEVEAGAATLDINVAIASGEAGIAGLEFMSGIPGTIGGALRMNGGAYGFEMKDVMVSACAVDMKGRPRVIDNAAMGFVYRGSAAPKDWIFVSARLRGRAGDRDTILRRMAEIRAQREATQPIRNSTGGSTFKNPPGHKAWALIDAAGCRGLMRGAAQVSEKHANFLINTGGATAADIEGLGEEVRRRVFEKSGVKLEWEIHRIGVAAGPAAEEVAP